MAFDGSKLPQIKSVREFVQRHLSRLNSTTGIFASESYLLKDGRLSGIKFTLGGFSAQWEWGNREKIQKGTQEITILEMDENGVSQKLGELTIELPTDHGTQDGRIAA